MKAKIIYELTEETLEKDIDVFIEETKKGRYAWDSKYGNEGLCIIKQYFKILDKKFKNNEFQECEICYEKLILFCLDNSNPDRDEDLFGYADLLAKVSSNFDRFIKNYFVCLIKNCKIQELSEKVSNYASRLGDCGFDSDREILLKNLTKDQLSELEKLSLAKTAGMTKKDRGKQDIVYFFIWLAQSQKNKEKYLNLCERFKEILPKDEFDYLKGEYDEEG
jgi:hypothetical protein